MRYILVNVIIFLAPMSGFNQVLAEDQSINRLVSDVFRYRKALENINISKVGFSAALADVMHKQDSRQSSICVILEQIGHPRRQAQVRNPILFIRDIVYQWFQRDKACCSL